MKIRFHRTIEKVTIFDDKKNVSISFPSKYHKELYRKKENGEKHKGYF